MDLSKFNDNDLQALKSRNLGAMSEAGLLELKAQRVGALGREGVTKSAPPKFTPGSYQEPTGAEKVAGHPLTRFAMGAASPALGLMQLLDNAAGGDTMNQHLQELEGIKTRGSEVNMPGGGAAEMTGAILNPANRLLPLGGSRVAGRTAAGAAGGAAAAATTPVTDGGTDFWKKKLADITSGTAVGAVIPPLASIASKTGRTAYHGLVEPITNPTAIKGRAYVEAAGDKSDEIIELLARNKQLVKGSAPTAGEAAVPAGRAEFSALQEGAAKVKPSDYLQRADEQNAARVAALNEFAGNPAKRAEAVATREAAAGPHYTAGMQQQATTSGLQDLMERPSSKAALSRAERLMKEKDKDFAGLFPNGLPRSMSGEEAQAIKLSFDDLIKAMPKSGMDTAELRAIQDTRRAYVDWMEKSFPELGKGRQAYKAGSVQVNEMDVGEELVKKATPALRGDKNMRSEGFSAAVRDASTTIKKATGEPRFQQLEDVLTTRALQNVHNVQDDLARADRHGDMARRGSQAAPDAISLATGNLEREVGGKLPNLLNRHAMLFNAVVNRLEGRVNKKLASEMATEMLDPPKVGESLAAAKVREARNKVIAEALLKGQRLAIVGGAQAAANQGD